MSLQATDAFAEDALNSTDEDEVAADPAAEHQMMRGVLDSLLVEDEDVTPVRHLNPGVVTNALKTLSACKLSWPYVKCIFLDGKATMCLGNGMC